MFSKLKERVVIFFVSLSVAAYVGARFPPCHISHWAQNLRERKISRYFDKLERPSFFHYSCSSVSSFSPKNNERSRDRCGVRRRAEGDATRARRMCDADDIRKTVALLWPQATPPQSYPPKRPKMRREDGIKFCGLILCFGGSELICSSCSNGGVISFLRAKTTLSQSQSLSSLPASLIHSLSSLSWLRKCGTINFGANKGAWLVGWLAGCLPAFPHFEHIINSGGKARNKREKVAKLHQLQMPILFYDGESVTILHP